MSGTQGKNRGLKKAFLLFRERKYTETIRLLEPQVFTYRENPTFYYLLGISCLHTGDFAGAYSYLKRSVQLEPHYIDALLGLAVVHLKRLETNESLKIWLEILDDDPKNRIAKRGLDVLKKNAEPEGLDAFFETGKMKTLIPSPGFFIPKGVKIALPLVFCLIALLPVGYLMRSRFFGEKESVRPEIAAVILGDRDSIVDTNEKSVYMLSEKEIAQAFDAVKKLFEDYKDNLARREINRLLLSNAGRSVKEKLRIFLPHIRTPSFAAPWESFPYQEVVSSPRLYEGCFVNWKGRISNLKITEKEITFDFLVGYHDQRVLEGIVPARMDFAAKVDPAFAYEIIGQIVLRNEKSISLKIVSLHELGL